jgi:nitrilase
MSLNSNKPQVAVIQMVSGLDVDANLQQALQQLQACKEAGIELAVLPENFAVFSAAQYQAAGQLEASVAGPIRQWLSHQAKALGMWLVGGTIPCADGVQNPQRVRTSCFVYDAEGKQAARYDKIHLFDANVNDDMGAYRESDSFEAGDDIVVVDTPVGRLGLTTCYDLRFPELHRALRDKGAELISNGAAFTQRTGEAHWQPLLRARAIETQCYMLAAAQGGVHGKRQTYGHSMIVNPWGEVLQEMEVGPGYVSAEIDLAYVSELRQAMPIDQHRRI